MVFFIFGGYAFSSGPRGKERIAIFRLDRFSRLDRKGGVAGKLMANRICVTLQHLSDPTRSFG